MNKTNIQFHNTNSDVVVFVLPGARGSCYSQSQTDIYNFFITKGISCISTNYTHQDQKKSFFMADNFESEKQSLYQQIKEFWEEIQKEHNYKRVILIGNSLGGVLFNHLISMFGEKIEHFFILGYLTGYIKPENIISPTTIIQGEYDKYGGIQKVQENIKDKKVSLHEIPNSDHSYFDIKDPSIRRNQDAYNIIFHLINYL